MTKGTAETKKKLKKQEKKEEDEKPQQKLKKEPDVKKARQQAREASNNAKLEAAFLQFRKNIKKAMTANEATKTLMKYQVVKKKVEGTKSLLDGDKNNNKQTKKKKKDKSADLLDVNESLKRHAKQQKLEAEKNIKWSKEIDTKIINERGAGRAFRMMSKDIQQMEGIKDVIIISAAAVKKRHQTLTRMLKTEQREREKNVMKEEEQQDEKEAKDFSNQWNRACAIQDPDEQKKLARRTHDSESEDE